MNPANLVLVADSEDFALASELLAPDFDKTSLKHSVYLLYVLVKTLSLASANCN